jgi:DNA repair protein SbcD/Mre11
VSVSEGVRLLAVGDIHLGTRPGSLPVSLADHGLEMSALTPEAALSGAVERAIQERVHAVLFAGDVVDSTNARFEALRPLEKAVADLCAAGIRVLAVVGNHDVEALPRLAKRIEGLELIGAGGSWESRVVEVAGRPAVEVVGWSFPKARVGTSPVDALNREPLERENAGIPRLGLLHGDLDASAGPYAPFSREELGEADVDAWLLGHIHKPSLGGGARTGSGKLYGYLGSLVGLNPSETGPHGPWLIRVDAAGNVVPEQLTIAPLRWEHIDLEVGESESPEDLGDRLLDEAKRVARELDEQGHNPRALGLRVRLVGSTCHFDALRKYIDHNDWQDHVGQELDTVVFVDKVTHALELARDLEQLAKGDDPPALLARKLQVLTRGGEDRDALLAKAREQLRSVADESCWRRLERLRDADDPLSDERLGAALLQSGTIALNALLNQCQAAEAPKEAAP